MHIYPPRCPSESLIHNSRESAICILVILNSIHVVTIKQCLLCYHHQKSNTVVIIIIIMNIGFKGKNSDDVSHFSSFPSSVNYTSFLYINLFSHCNSSIYPKSCLYLIHFLRMIHINWGECLLIICYSSCYVLRDEPYFMECIAG